MQVKRIAAAPHSRDSREEAEAAAAASPAGEPARESVRSISLTGLRDPVPTAELAQQRSAPLSLRGGPTAAEGLAIGPFVATAEVRYCSFASALLQLPVSGQCVLGKLANAGQLFNEICAKASRDASRHCSSAIAAAGEPQFGKLN